MVCVQVVYTGPHYVFGNAQLKTQLKSTQLHLDRKTKEKKRIKKDANREEKRVSERRALAVAGLFFRWQSVFLANTVGVGSTAFGQSNNDEAGDHPTHCRPHFSSLYDDI